MRQTLNVWERVTIPNYIHEEIKSRLNSRNSVQIVRLPVNIWRIFQNKEIRLKTTLIKL
jgi:hypothetical protein